MPKEGDDIDKDRLGPRHWLLLDRLQDILHSYEATLCSEGKRDHPGQWFITMDWLPNEAWTSQETFRQLKESFPVGRNTLFLQLLLQPVRRRLSSATSRQTSALRTTPQLLYSLMSNGTGLGSFQLLQGSSTRR